MNLKFYFSAILLAVVSTVSAQFQGLKPIAAFEDSPGNPLQEYVKTYRPSTIPREFTGHYYLDKEFAPGTLLVNEGEKSLNVLLRYNALKDNVEVKLGKEKDSIYVLPNLGNISYNTPQYTFKYGEFSTSNGEFKRGYFIYYYDGEKITFLSKPMAHMKEEVMPRSGYDTYQPAHFSVKKFYYLLGEDGILQEFDLKERSLKKVISDKRMKKYFSSHRINTVEEVVEMLQFYDGLEEQS